MKRVKAISDNLPSIRLTEKQLSFVRYLAEGLEATEAARLAGYTIHDNVVSRLIRAPTILAALEIELRKRLHIGLVPLAFRVIEAILRNEDASDRVRADLAIKLIDRGGFVPPRQASASGDDREPEGMSTAELHALIARLEGELGERAKPVSAPSEAQAIDDA